MAWRAIGARSPPVSFQPAAFKGALRWSLVLSKGIQSKFATTCCHFHTHHGSDSSSNSDNTAPPCAASSQAQAQAAHPQEVPARQATPNLQGLWGLKHLRAWQAAVLLQGLWWLKLLRARQATQKLQGLRWLRHLRAQQATQRLRRVSEPPMHD